MKKYGFIIHTSLIPGLTKESVHAMLADIFAWVKSIFSWKSEYGFLQVILALVYENLVLKVQLVLCKWHWKQLYQSW